MKHSAKTIIEALTRNYEKSAKYLVPNIYAFVHAYGETDFLVVNQKGFCYDIEVKISRADYLADFKKEKKHSILANAHYTLPYRYGTGKKSKRSRFVEEGKPIFVKTRPNRFYYAVPTGLVTKQEVPAYAGLLYVDELGDVTKVKEAKLLHKNKLNIEKLLCRKFYFYWMNAKNDLEICKG